MEEDKVVIHLHKPDLNEKLFFCISGLIYLIAVALHFSNNLLAVAGQVWLIGGPAIMLVTYYLAWYFYNSTAERIVK